MKTHGLSWGLMALVTAGVLFVSLSQRVYAEDQDRDGLYFHQDNKNVVDDARHTRDDHNMIAEDRDDVRHDHHDTGRDVGSGNWNDNGTDRRDNHGDAWDNRNNVPFYGGGPQNRDGNLGRVWYEREGVYTGVWTRRGNSNVFDAVWTARGERTVTAVLTIQISGNNVYIQRRYGNPRADFDYWGHLSYDGARVSGNFSAGYWEATIAGYR